MGTGTAGVHGHPAMEAVVVQPAYRKSSELVLILHPHTLERDALETHKINGFAINHLVVCISRANDDKKTK